jgi:hypothetical protein
MKIQDEWFGKAYPIPEVKPSFKEISEQLRINADILMKEMSEHADKEIERIRKEVKRK